MSKFWFTFLLLLGMVWSHPTFAASCSVQANSLPFASYTTLQTISKTVSSNISITCYPGVLELLTGVIVQVGLSQGEGAQNQGQGSALNRSMTNGRDKLYYNVYKDAGYQTILGDGAGQGQPFSLCMGALLCGNSSTNTVGTNLVLYMYGALPPKQDVSPGVYTDSLILRVTF